MRVDEVPKFGARAIIGTGLIIGFLAYELNIGFQATFSKTGPPLAMYFCMGPIVKTIFFATIQRQLIPKKHKLLVLSSLFATIVGAFICLFGSKIGNHIIGVLIVSVGFMITLFGFMPLQRIASARERDEKANS